MNSKRVLFVCTGNTCRSPMAEALFLEAVKGRGEIEVASAGVSAWPGESASRGTAELLKRRGIVFEHVSQPLDEELLEWATHVFAMTRSHLDRILAEFPEAAPKVHLVLDFVADPRQRGRDIPDPYGMGTKEYEAVAKVLDTAIPSLLEKIDAVEGEA